MKSFKFIFAGIFLWIAVISIASGSGYAETSQGQAKILNVEGQVKAKAPSTADWKTAKQGDWLTAGAEITTGPNSTCEIALGEGLKSAAKLRADSKATLTSLDPVKIDIQSGKILSMVRSLRSGSTFQVTTPTAIGSARGTGWEQDANSVQVFEDTVHVTGTSGQENDIPEGKGIEIGDDGKLGDMFDVSGESKKDWNEFKSDTQGAKGDADSTPKEGFGGDTHETLDTSSAHEELGDPLDEGDVKADSTEQRNEEKHLNDMLNPERIPDPAPTGS